MTAALPVQVSGKNGTGNRSGVVPLSGITEICRNVSASVRLLKPVMKPVSASVFQIKLGPVNAFIIEDKGLTLVDTGYRGDMKKIFAALIRAGRDPKDIKQILLTHCHPDHAGSAADIKRALQIPVFAHRSDAALMEAGISGRYPFEVSPGPVNRIAYHLFIKRAAKTIMPFGVETFLEDGAILPVAGGLQVIHTPGHSAGHVSLLVKKEGVLIAGDICANLSGLKLSAVYENRLSGKASILKAAAFDFGKAVFGHGNPILHNASVRLKARFFTANNS